LWKVSQNKGPDEYRDADTFFRRTYTTQGLDALQKAVENRLRGAGGDAVIQLKTPFGGGKTHALIALYHKAKVWGARPVVIAGTQLEAEQTLWSLIEAQLTEAVVDFKEKTSPGREKLEKLLAKTAPVLILIDELLGYAVKASGVKVGESTLADQTTVFLQELTEAAASMDKISVVMTLQSSHTEQYGEKGIEIARRLEKVVGRVEQIYTPVQENEITEVVRRRLFKSINKPEVKETIEEFLDYAEQERFLPKDMKRTEYRDLFVKSYPFMPEVIDVLYKRWGSYHTFQRTRGVLRLLAQVVSSMMSKKGPYISLSDFDLNNDVIRNELLKHLDSTYNSVIDADIGSSSNASEIDSNLGASHQGFNYGIRAATCIFMYSFSGGTEKGVEKSTVKRCTSVHPETSSIVGEVIDLSENKLHYLQSHGEKLVFSNQPNLNHLILTVIDNIRDIQLLEKEEELIKEYLRPRKFHVSRWESDTSKVPDEQQLKLVVLQKGDSSLIKKMIKEKGQTPRVRQNSVFFLYPDETERMNFENTVKRAIGYEQIRNDTTLNLSEEQKRTVIRDHRKSDDNLKPSLLRLYRKLAVPARNGFVEKQLDINDSSSELGEEIYAFLKRENEILEKIHPQALIQEYLTSNDSVSIINMYNSSLQTPGEIRFSSREVLENAIIEGVRLGDYGLGEISNGTLTCKYFNEVPTVYFSDNEVLIKKGICIKTPSAPPVTPSGALGTTQTPPIPESGSETTTTGSTSPVPNQVSRISIEFTPGAGSFSHIPNLIRYIHSQFKKLRISIHAEDGSISRSDYELNVKEALDTMDISDVEEDIEE